MYVTQRGASITRKLRLKETAKLEWFLLYLVEDGELRINKIEIKEFNIKVIIGRSSARQVH